MKQTKQKKWYDYLWIWSILYFSLGFFNILFAWLGMIDFIVPLLFAIIGGNKNFCNKYCGRGQLFTLLGSQLKGSRNKATPKWMFSKCDTSWVNAEETRFTNRVPFDVDKNCFVTEDQITS